MVAEPKETEDALPAVHSSGWFPHRGARGARRWHLRPWSVAATATITCFSEMDVDRAGALRRRADGGAAAARLGSGAQGALDSSSSGSSRGAGCAKFILTLC